MKKICINNRIFHIFSFVFLFSTISFQIQAHGSLEENKEFILKMLKTLSGHEKTKETLRPFIAEEKWIESIIRLDKTFPNYEVVPEDILAEGDKVVLRGIFKGKHLGPMGDIEPTGKEVSYNIMVIYRIANGKIVEHWSVADNLTRLKQLGLYE